MAEIRKLKVFLCHTFVDKPAVRDLYKQLHEDGIDPWLDEEELLPGQDWREEIPKAVRATDAILVCLSPRSVTKEGYVQREIRVALDAAEEKLEGSIYIIPLKLEECEIPERLQQWQAENLSTEGAYNKLKRSLQTRADQLGIDSTVFFECPQNPSLKYFAYSWERFLEAVQKKKLSLFFALKSAPIRGLTHLSLQIGISKDPYYKEVLRQENRVILEEAAQGLFGSSVSVEIFRVIEDK